KQTLVISKCRATYFISIQAAEASSCRPSSPVPWVLFSSLKILPCLCGFFFHGYSVKETTNFEASCAP
ncbi:MAG: hypothetical protein WKF70_01625, partial [Chitinophagaceae bacterium]